MPETDTTSTSEIAHSEAHDSPHVLHAGAVAGRLLPSGPVSAATDSLHAQHDTSTSPAVDNASQVGTDSQTNGSDTSPATTEVIPMPAFSQVNANAPNIPSVLSAVVNLSYLTDAGFVVRWDSPGQGSSHAIYGQGSAALFSTSATEETNNVTQEEQHGPVRGQGKTL